MKTADALGRGCPCPGSYSATSRSTPRLLASSQGMRTSKHRARHERGPPDSSSTYPSCVTRLAYAKVMHRLGTKRRTCFIAYNLPVLRSFTRETTPNAPNMQQLERLQTTGGASTILTVTDGL